MRSTADDNRRDAATARAVDAAREKINSLAQPANLVEGSDSLGIAIEVAAPYGAGELSILNRSYALVASGVGWVNASLPPGTYSVRHQVGGELAIDAIEVVKGGPRKFNLPFLNFASPIPLFGTRYFYDGSDLKSLARAGGNFRLLVWAQAPRTSVGTDKNRTQIEAELKRLRLEVFAAAGPLARQGIKLPPPTWTSSGSALISITLEPGCYVIVQSDPSGRQRCLPAWINSGMITCIFLLSLEEGGTAVPLNLDHAGITFQLVDGKRGKRWIESLYQLEVTRKTLHIGRQVQGWAGKSKNSADYTKENPLLHLLDAILVFGSAGSPSKDVSLEYGSCAAARFESSFPDAQALRIAMRRLKPDSSEPLLKDFTFAGPPLLRRTWELLLRNPSGNDALGKIMDFPFAAEGDGAWFIWSEDPPQTQRKLNTGQRDFRHRGMPISIGALPPLRATALSALLVQGAKLIGGVLTKGRSTEQDTRVVAGEPHPDAAALTPRGKLTAPAAPVVSFDTVVGLLVALTEENLIQKYLDIGLRYATSRGVKTDGQVLFRLVQSLNVLEDNTLVKGLTAKVLVREALVGLSLPNEKVIQLVQAVLIDLMSSLGEHDRALAYKVMARVFDAAEQWLPIAPPGGG